MPHLGWQLPTHPKSMTITNWSGANKFGQLLELTGVVPSCPLLHLLPLENHRAAAVLLLFQGQSMMAEIQLR